MQKSESIGKLSKALTAVQSQIKPALKDAANPFYKSTYADLNSVWGAARDLLAKNGLSVIQGNSVGIDNTVIVETILAHESGEWIQSELALPLSKSDPQGVGSAVTYGRRYGLAAIVGIVADADDDGNHASGKNGNGHTPAPAPKISPNIATLQKEIKVRCSELNKAKDSIEWKPAVLNEYIAETMDATVTFDTATEAQLRTIAHDLTERLDALKGDK